VDILNGKTRKEGNGMSLKFALDELATEGEHTARIIAVKELGIVKGQFRSEEKIRITFEMIDQPDANGDFAKVSMTYALKATKGSHLGKLLDDMGWARDGKEFNIQCLLNETLRVNIQHNRDGKFANVTNVIPTEGYVRTVRFASQCDFSEHSQQCVEFTYERFCSEHGGAA
jgi:hypothetical protein